MKSASTILSGSDRQDNTENMSEAPINIGVIGPAGFSGSYLCLELISRGHRVVGISRHPEKIGNHSRYQPRPADVNHLDINSLAKVFEGLDVLVNAYGPHSAGHEALQYSGCS